MIKYDATFVLMKTFMDSTCMHKSFKAFTDWIQLKNDKELYGLGLI